MPIVDGDIVAPHLASAALVRTVFGPGTQPQPPIFGIVDDATGGPPATDIDVLWFGTGQLVTDIDPSTLDVILPPDSGEVDRLQGRIVKVNPDNAQFSPEYQGRVIALYIRDLEGEGEPTSTLALIRGADGTYTELQSDQLIVAPGR